MTDHTAAIYRHSQRTWDAETCEKLEKRLVRDGLGTPYPFKGYLRPEELGHFVFGRSVLYNGGCIRDGKWWQGEQWPLPKLAEGYRIVHVPTWGYRIVKTDSP